GRCGAQPVAFGRPRAHGRRRARRPHVQAGRAVYFSRMTDDNLDALVAWVRTIPPLDWVSNESEHARRRVLRTGNRKISRRRPARSLALARAFVAAVIHALAGHVVAGAAMPAAPAMETLAALVVLAVVVAVGAVVRMTALASLALLAGLWLA